MKHLAWDWLIFELPIIFAVLIAAASVFGFDGDMFDADTDTDDSLLSFLGLGRVPLIVILFSYPLVFGFTGLLIKHGLLWSNSNVSFQVCMSTLMAAGWGTVLSKLFARWLPSVETYVPSQQGLVGLVGIVRDGIPAGYVGSIAVPFNEKPTMHVLGVTQDGWTAPAGACVVLESFDGKVFSVVPYERAVEVLDE